MIRHTQVRTDGPGMYEITSAVQDAVASSGLDEGLCTIMIRHTSASLVVQENADPSARRDLESWMDRHVPEGNPHFTHTAEGPDDMPSHIKAALTATTLSIPFEARRLEDGGVPETIDDGTWLMEWFEADVLPALARGDAYTNDVPFKSAHAPRDSDGVLQPTPVHFRGPFAVISGPSGGSHLDQFVHQVVDNDLGPVVGMPPGGYSNTWEWEEVLTFPGTDQPAVRFMWNIGHTITPNGEIAEGNPAEIDEWVPLTADNVRDYYRLLLETAVRRLAAG